MYNNIIPNKTIVVHVDPLLDTPPIPQLAGRSKRSVGLHPIRVKSSGLVSFPITDLIKKSKKIHVGKNLDEFVFCFQNQNDWGKLKTCVVLVSIAKQNPLVKCQTNKGLLIKG